MRHAASIAQPFGLGASGPAERANFPSFAVELCDLLGLDHPEPAGADAAHDRYRFEDPVTFRHPDGTTSTGRSPTAAARPGTPRTGTEGRTGSAGRR